MKRKHFSKLLFATLLGVSGAWFVSCKDFEPDIRTELQTQIKGIETGLSGAIDEYVEEMEERMGELQSKLDQLKQCQCTPTDLSKLENDIKDLQDDIDALQKKIKKWGDVGQRLTELEKDHGYLTKDGLKTVLPSILEELGYSKGGNGLTKAQVQAMIDEALEGYLTDKDIEGLATEEALAKLETNLYNQFQNYYTKEEVKALIKNIVELVKNNYYTKEEIYNKKEIDEKINDLVRNDELKEKVENILKDLEIVDREELNDSLTSLATELRTEFKKEIDRLDERIDEVDTLLKQVLNSMITGIIINGTENPVFGSASLPADIRTTVLAAYYGKATEAFTFPKEADFNGISIGDPIGVDAGEYIFNTKDGNAGKLYLTINPNTVSFEGQPIELVTSQGNESPIKLSNLAYSEKELSFGYSRAASDNGFYEAVATLSEEDIQKVKANINFNDIRSAAADVIKQKNKTSVAKLAEELFNNSANILPAYAVRASWSYDLVEESEGEEKTTSTVSNNVLSQYALAATAVKPLSYDFMKDAQFNIPFLERFENLVGNGIDGLFRQIKDAIPDLSNIGEIPDFKIELSEATKEKLIITCHIEIPAKQLTSTLPEDETITVVDKDGKEIGTAKIGGVKFENDLCKFDYKLDLTKEIGSIIDDINDSFDMSQLQELVNNLAAISEVGTNLDNMRDNIKNKIFGYIDRLNSRFNALVGSVNTSLQPCMLFLDNNGNVAGRLTTSPTGSIVSGTSIKLAPTSYTAELFAPAYKKCVAVTAINGKTAGCNEFNSSNNDLATVLDGDVDEITINGLKSGNVYKITYSAVDYHGITRTKNYYIAVK